MRKDAVDAVTKAYWEEYYKDYDYGRMWVREIPRYIRAAFVPQLRRKANGEVPLVQVIPLGYAVLKDKGLKTDGIVRQGRKDRLFTAEFSASGDLRHFEVV